MSVIKKLAGFVGESIPIVNKKTGKMNGIISENDVLKAYLEYCLIQENKGHPFSRTLKHVFGLNKGLKNAKAYRRLILQTMQEKKLEANMEELIAMV